MQEAHECTSTAFEILIRNDQVCQYGMASDAHVEAIDQIDINSELSLNYTVHTHTYTHTMSFVLEMTAAGLFRRYSTLNIREIVK